MNWLLVILLFQLPLFAEDFWHSPLTQEEAKQVADSVQLCLSTEDFSPLLKPGVLEMTLQGVLDPEPKRPNSIFPVVEITQGKQRYYALFCTKKGKSKTVSSLLFLSADFPLPSLQLWMDIYAKALPQLKLKADRSLLFIEKTDLPASIKERQEVKNCLLNKHPALLTQAWHFSEGGKQETFYTLSVPANGGTDFALIIP